MYKALTSRYHTTRERDQRTQTFHRLNRTETLGWRLVRAFLNLLRYEVITGMKSKIANERYTDPYGASTLCSAVEPAYPVEELRPAEPHRPGSLRLL